MILECTGWNAAALVGARHHELLGRAQNPREVRRIIRLSTSGSLARIGLEPAGQSAAGSSPGLVIAGGAVEDLLNVDFHLSEE